MTSTAAASTRLSPRSDDLYRCSVCLTAKPVPSLARDCEQRHYPKPASVRGTAEIADPDSLGGFECRWYAHRGGRPVKFTTAAEVEIYMARLGLCRPDELLAPIAA